jgi:hypothetical protein
MTCPKECPCKWPKDTILTASNRIEIEMNHFDADGEPRIDTQPVSAAQGDIHWLDWHGEDR